MNFKVSYIPQLQLDITIMNGLPRFTVKTDTAKLIAVSWFTTTRLSELITIVIIIWYPLQQENISRRRIIKCCYV